MNKGIIYREEVPEDLLIKRMKKSIIALMLSKENN